MFSMRRSAAFMMPSRKPTFCRPCLRARHSSRRGQPCLWLREIPAAAAEPSLVGLSKEDQDLHKKAKRFARLLVDEIKLYNPAKVAEGKQKKDLYARLKEDIDKSRATYEKRYGATNAGKAGYFNA